MVSNNRKGNLYMALIGSPALKWHNMAEPTFAHFWMWSRCCLRHQVWRSEAASYVKNSGGRIAKNWNPCSISRLHGEMTCRILNWNVHEHNEHTTYRSLGQVLKVPHLARQKKCLKGRGRFFSKLWWNASGISSSSSAEIARKLPAVFFSSDRPTNKSLFTMCRYQIFTPSISFPYVAALAELFCHPLMLPGRTRWTP